MTIQATTYRLRRRYDTPDRLTAEFLQARMEELEGWHKDAADLARDSDTSIQEAVEHLVGALTPAEHHAAKQLFATVYPLVTRQGLKVYEKIDPPEHEVAREEVVGLAWAVFVRCLATYDGSSHLTTWLTIACRPHFRGYLLSIRDRNDTSRHYRARRKVYELERQKLAEKGRRPTREEYEEAVRSVHHGWEEGDVNHVIDYLTGQDLPMRLDRPMDEDGDDLYEVVPAGDREPEGRAKDVGERLAERLGMEDLWEKLTATENKESSRATTQ